MSTKAAAKKAAAETKLVISTKVGRFIASKAARAGVVWRVSSTATSWTSSSS